jgi:hypothetical protein
MSVDTHEPKAISEARRAAARANGAKSNGPVTPEGKAKSALNSVTHGLTASAVVLTTESKEQYEALLASYREKCDPDGPIENALVDQLAAADWQQRRITAMITALLDVTMDRMEKEISEEFDNLDNATRTVLAFRKEARDSGTLALLNRYAARHARDIHRTLNDLKKIQAERREQSTAPQATNSTQATRHKRLATEPPAIDHCILQNEPNESPAAGSPTVTPLAVRQPLNTETSHRPPATDHCISQNEPKPPSVEEIDDRIAS